MKTSKPVTPSRRHYQVADSSVLTSSEPFKPLVFFKKRSKGRSHGRITTRHKGGGNKKLYRKIYFGQEKKGVEGVVKSIEYDPFRTTYIALVSYKDGDWGYILAPKDLKVGDKIICDENAPIEIGNRLMLKNIPVGTLVHNIEIRPSGKGKIARAAGTYAQLLAIDEGYAFLKMPSGEIRKVPENCYASIGQLSKEEHNIIKIGKAGRARHMGIRPTVRGSAMNAVDHPYGGGEGKTQRGTRRPKDIWGNITGGRKTRKKNKYSKNLIVQRRPKKKKK
jgi:large subunit ribosomal protein L2